jgi:hypothetical protein
MKTSDQISVRLYEGERISIDVGGKVARAYVLRPSWVAATLLHSDGIRAVTVGGGRVWTRHRDEGMHWARGWEGESVDALKAAVALMGRATLLRSFPLSDEDFLNIGPH